MPVFQFDAQDAPAGLENYWGYSPMSFFAPHCGYSSRHDPLGCLDEFRDMVKALTRPILRSFSMWCTTTLTTIFVNNNCFHDLSPIVMRPQGQSAPRTDVFFISSVEAELVGCEQPSKCKLYVALVCPHRLSCRDCTSVASPKQLNDGIGDTLVLASCNAHKFNSYFGLGRYVRPIDSDIVIPA
jgi:hypothetical protein